MSDVCPKIGLQAREVAQEVADSRISFRPLFKPIKGKELLLNLRKQQRGRWMISSKFARFIKIRAISLDTFCSRTLLDRAVAPFEGSATIYHPPFGGRIL